MSYAPASLVNAMRFWTKQGGVNLGIVGDSAHAARASYHNGRDAIQKYGRTASSDYSIRTARDRAGLTNAASAVDLGRIGGSLIRLWDFSEWFAQQCIARRPGFSDVREVIFWSRSRNRVVGWSAINPSNTLINDYGDMGHKTHTHISFYRDSEKRDKTPLFSAYPKFQSPDTEEEMQLVRSLPGWTTTVKKTANIRSGPYLTSPILRVVDIPENWSVIGAVKGSVDPDSESDHWYVRWANGRWEYTALANLITLPVKPPTLVELAAAKDAAAKAQAAATTLTRKIEAARASLA